MPIEFVRVTCFNKAHFEEPFFFNMCGSQEHAMWVFVTFGIPITEAQCLCVRNKTQPLQSAKTYDQQKHLLSDLLHLTNTIIAIHKDIRPFETFTFRSPTLNKHNHCSPQRHTILLLDFLFVSVAAVRKDIRPEETCTFRSPTLNKHNHCSPQRHTKLLFDFLFCS